ncbi:hypothetical protein [Acinetobacter sp. B51(2017)]|uniref:hypothetical protein n=1 Tax=Acinetobacter sp. B51(2017) TaxID=2060938 RepID=UPI000F079E5D|nr:hypothetical protein [Acinetobacter sp. B51(2017)]
MPKVNEAKSEKKIYEKLVPLSSVDAIRVGLNDKKKIAILEFGYSKSSNVIAIDVRKELTVEMVENLINNLQSCLDDLKEL